MAAMIGEPKRIQESTAWTETTAITIHNAARVERSPATIGSIDTTPYFIIAPSRAALMAAVQSTTKKTGSPGTIFRNGSWAKPTTITARNTRRQLPKLTAKARNAATSNIKDRSVIRRDGPRDRAIVARPAASRPPRGDSQRPLDPRQGAPDRVAAGDQPLGKWGWASAAGGPAPPRRAYRAQSAVVRPERQRPGRIPI